MTLVPSRRLRLNGSKFLILLLVVVLVSSCTTRKVAYKPPVNNTVQPTPQNKIAPSAFVNKNVKPQEVQKIALILPFKLDQIHAENRSEIEASSLSLDFYQGFKLALDSLAHHGSQLELQVLDSEDQTGKIDQYLSEGRLKNTKFVIGPVYPEQIERVSDYASKNHTFFVSPFSPQPLSRFHNPNLIMINSPLEGYAGETAHFIQDKYPAAHILVIHQSDADDKFIDPLKAILTNVDLLTITPSSKLSSIKSKLDPNLENVLIVPSLDKAFWSKLMVYLVDLKTSVPLVLFAHPSFEHLQVSNPALLQQFDLHFASTYFVDKANPRIQEFIRLYKSLYFTMPGPNAFIGYDVGTYFGTLVASAESPENELKHSDFQGLHNQFIFKNIDGLGYWNSSINMVHYEQGHLVADK